MLTERLLSTFSIGCGGSAVAAPVAIALRVLLRTDVLVYEQVGVAEGERLSAQVGADG